MLKFYYSTETDPSLIPTNEGVADVTKCWKNWTNWACRWSWSTLPD